MSWYGLTSDHETIPRKVVQYGMYVKSPQVMKFRLGLKSDPGTLVTRQFSRLDTIGECW